MHYVAIVTREGEHWLAEFPDAPGCQTFADSEEELRAMAAEALEGWLETTLDHGDLPPTRKLHRRGEGRMLVPVAPAIALALRLRWARAKAKLTQGELAERAGLKQQAVARLERPGSNPTIATLARVAEALGGSLDVRLA